MHQTIIKEYFGGGLILNRIQQSCVQFNRTVFDCIYKYLKETSTSFYNKRLFVLVTKLVIVTADR